MGTESLLLVVFHFGETAFPFCSVWLSKGERKTSRPTTDRCIKRRVHGAPLQPSLDDAPELRSRGALCLSWGWRDVTGAALGTAALLATSLPVKTFSCPTTLFDGRQLSV